MKLILEVSITNTVEIVVEADSPQDIYDLLNEDSAQALALRKVIEEREADYYEEEERDYNVYYPRYEYTDDDVDFKIKSK